MKNKITLINVLTNEAYQDCHIKNSINVPIDKLEKYALKNLDKENDTIIVHCFSYNCKLSTRAFNILKDLGFKNVFAYEGGIAEWFQLGYEVEGACKNPNLSIKALPQNTQARTISAQELKKILYNV